MNYDAIIRVRDSRPTRDRRKLPDLVRIILEDYIAEAKLAPIVPNVSGVPVVYPPARRIKANLNDK